MNLKIALTIDPEFPLPPTHYGGIERIVDMLANGLLDRGHDVTLFAHRDTIFKGELVPWPGTRSRNMRDTIQNALVLRRNVMSLDFDIIHSHSRLAYLTPIMFHSVPKLMTYHRVVSRKTTNLAVLLSKGTVEFSAISKWQMQPVENIGRWHHVPNGVQISNYQYRESVRESAPLVFLGRIEDFKGPHIAIEVARRANRRLLIAGNVPLERKQWFQEHVEPHIDGEKVQYVGPVDDFQKNEILGSAAALLMPLLEGEPFGLVMAEAMACGTPVLGLSEGAVPEVVEDGVTGFVRDSIDGLVEACTNIGAINRKACRERVEKYYSDSAVVDGYVNAYRSIIQRHQV